MIEIIDTNDSRAVRNKNNVLALYDLMINAKKCRRGHGQIGEPGLISTDSHRATVRSALGKFFVQITRERAAGQRRRPPYHRRRRLCMGARELSRISSMTTRKIPEIVGVDIYKMDADGKAIEHWDTLQVVGDPKNSAPLIAPNIPRATPTECSERENLP